MTAPRCFFRAEFPTSDVWIFDDPVTPDGCHISSRVLRGPGSLKALSDLACWGNEHHGDVAAALGADPSLSPDEQLRELFRRSVAKLRHPRPDMGPQFWPARESWRVPFTWAGTGYLLLLADRVCRLLNELDHEGFDAFDVQTPEADERFAVVKVRHAIDCIDDDASEFVERSDPVKKPSRAGDYSIVRGLRIRAAAIPPQRHIFYTKGFGAVIVSSELRDRMSRAGISGLGYSAVT